MFIIAAVLDLENVESELFRRDGITSLSSSLGICFWLLIQSLVPLALCYSQGRYKLACAMCREYSAIDLRRGIDLFDLGLTDLHL
jgi:hypothetical protein